jgi:hypothetical protein
MGNEKTMFEKLNAINVNGYVEQKNGLSYLSWSYAWAEFKKVYPEATYEILKFNNNLPYVYDENTGYMVFTRVTADGLTHEMWLPVMDGANKAMKSQPYTYDTKFKKGLTVEAASMFDINKTIMRCLVKNLAMFGLGLYIYSGEDLPEEQKDPAIDDKTIGSINDCVNKYAEIKKGNAEELTKYYLNKFKVDKLEALKLSQGTQIVNELNNLIKRRAS